MSVWTFPIVAAITVSLAIAMGLELGYLMVPDVAPRPAGESAKWVEFNPAGQDPYASMDIAIGKWLNESKCFEKSCDFACRYWVSGKVDCRILLNTNEAMKELEIE